MTDSPSSTSDDPPPIDDLDPFEIDIEEYDDINEFVRDDWKASTTARERLETIATNLTEPTTVGEVAAIALVSEPTARKELKRLVEYGILTSEETANGTVYYRDPDWYRSQRIGSLRTKPTPELERRLQALTNEIDGYQGIYGYSEPTEFVIEASEISDETWDDISHWRTAVIDREYIRTALRHQRLAEIEQRYQTESPEPSTSLQ